MFTTEETTYYEKEMNRNEKWRIFWIGWMENYISNVFDTRSREIVYSLKTIKSVAINEFNKTFNERI